MKKELNADGSQMPLMQLTLLTGFIGGVFGCLFGYLVHTFHFTMISPAVILGPWQGAWKAGMGRGCHHHTYIRTAVDVNGTALLFQC